MDGELLWNAMYWLIQQTARSGLTPPRGRGHPDDYQTWEIAAVWLWSAWRHQPLLTAVSELSDPLRRKALRGMGYHLPDRIPHEVTLRRRGRRPDMESFLTQVNRALIRLLHPHTDVLAMDSTPLLVPSHSHDHDATWGHHRQRGYRWHTLISSGGTILVDQVEGANVHELAVAPLLVQRAAADGVAARFVTADVGYDSEPLHGCVAHTLAARLVAPFNHRGGTGTMSATPYRAWLHRRWHCRRIRRVYRLRTNIERMYARLKGHRFGLYALPPWVRHLPTVRRWVQLKKLFYHLDLVFQHCQKAA
jgi:hypothetical protein